MVRTQAAATNRPRAKLEPFYKLITFFLGMSSIVVLNLLYRTFVLDSAKVVKEIVRTNHSASFGASNTSEANFNGILEVIFLATLILVRTTYVGCLILRSSGPLMGLFAAGRDLLHSDFIPRALWSVFFSWLLGKDNANCQEIQSL